MHNKREKMEKNISTFFLTDWLNPCMFAKIQKKVLSTFPFAKKGICEIAASGFVESWRFIEQRKLG